MARSLLINQLDKLIVDLEKEYRFYITYAEEINSKIAVLRKTKSIAIEKLNKKFPKKEYKRAFKHSLKMLLSQVLKENRDTFLSTVEITEKMLALDGQDTSLKLEEFYITAVKRAFRELLKQDIVLVDKKGRNPNATFWKLKV